MIYNTFPQTMTPENLASWIVTNALETKDHTDETPLLPDEIRDFEHESSLASRAIDRLNGIKESFIEVLKNGNSLDEPMEFKIPPTKGLKLLSANREFYDMQLERGFKINITTIYFVPSPEEAKAIGTDIEGKEWPEYTRDLTEPEMEKIGKLFIKYKTKKGKKSAGVTDTVKDIAKKFHGDLANSGIKVTSIDKETNTINMEVDQEEPEIPFI